MDSKGVFQANQEVESALHPAPWEGAPSAGSWEGEQTLLSQLLGKRSQVPPHLTGSPRTLSSSTHCQAPCRAGQSLIPPHQSQRGRKRTFEGVACSPPRLGHAWEAGLDCIIHQTSGKCTVPDSGEESVVNKFLLGWRTLWGPWPVGAACWDPDGMWQS